MSADTFSRGGPELCLDPRGATSKTKAAFFCDDVAFLEKGMKSVDWVYGKGRRAKLETLADCHPTIVTSDNFVELASELKDLEVIFSSWGMLNLTPDQLDLLPKLHAVFFAGGSVKSFARRLLEREILVISAWAANAVPVAEFTLGQILLSNKGYFRNAREYRAPEMYAKTPCENGNYGETVALLGAGQIGRKLIEMLRSFALRVIVFDPFLSDREAKGLGVTKVDLAEAFARGLVVSNHLADVPETRGMLGHRLFTSMREGATFINTGRGATVVEADLVDVLSGRPDLTALLDVTAPEPPSRKSPLYTMPNVYLSSHIAGSRSNEVLRMADYMIEEFNAWKLGKPLRYAVTLPMLETMA